MKKEEKIIEIKIANQILEELRIDWINEGKNHEFKPSIQVYTNATIISLWHSAAAPQHKRRAVISLSNVEGVDEEYNKKYNKFYTVDSIDHVGELIISYSSPGIYHELDVDKVIDYLD